MNYLDFKEKLDKENPFSRFHFLIDSFFSGMFLLIIVISSIVFLKQHAPLMAYIIICMPALLFSIAPLNKYYLFELKNNKVIIKHKTYFWIKRVFSLEDISKITFFFTRYPEGKNSFNRLGIQLSTKDKVYKYIIEYMNRNDICRLYKELEEVGIRVDYKTNYNFYKFFSHKDIFEKK